MPSATQRTLKMLRDEGYTCAITEHYNPHAHIRQDLFGAFDIAAIHTHWEGVLGVQCTTTGVAARRRKLLALDAVRVWLEAKNRAWIVGWRKIGKPARYQPRIVALELADVEREA